MKEIKLSKGLFTTVDDADYEHLSRFSWYAKQMPNTHYACSFGIDQNGKQYTIYMHRILLGLTDPKIFCDHIDGNGLNNQRNNIRPTTNSQNAMNRRISRNNTSGFNGVSFDKRRNKYAASLVVLGQTKHMGYFSNLDDAIKARRNAEEIYYGEFSRTHSQRQCAEGQPQ